MTFLKKHVVKILVVLLVLVLLFLLWYHIFPVKIPFDHTLYSESGEKVKLEGELQYYRSIFSKGGKAYGEVTFNGAEYGLAYGGPYMFTLYDLNMQGTLHQRDSITINFTENDYNKRLFVTKSLYPSGKAENYFLTRVNFYIENSDLAVVDKSKVRIKTNKDIVIVYGNGVKVKIP